MVIVVGGMIGLGKSSVAKLLGDRLGTDLAAGAENVAVNGLNGRLASKCSAF